jgi:hypothetical protein
MDPKVMMPFLITALVIFGIYRRMRRTFGRQPVSVGRMWVRVIIFAVVGFLFASYGVRNVSTLEALLAGVSFGTVLALLGLRHTQFEVTPEGRFYTPHTYIGLIVSALFLGRLAYRYVTLYNAMPAGAPNGDPTAMYQNNPITAAIFGVLVSYYILFNLGVLQKTRTPLPSAAPP